MTLAKKGDHSLFYIFVNGQEMRSSYSKEYVYAFNSEREAVEVAVKSYGNLNKIEVKRGNII